MLSKSEIKYLKNPSSFSANYSKVLRHRISSKARAFNEELSLLTNAGLVTKSCYRVTEFSNPDQKPKSGCFNESGAKLEPSAGFGPATITLPR